MLQGFVFALLFAVTLCSTASARACSWTPICLTEALPAQGSSIPANIKALGLRLCAYGAPPPSVVLMAEGAGESTAVDVEIEEARLSWERMGEPVSGPLDFWLLHIRGALKAGDKLVLRFREPIADDADAGVAKGEMSWPIVDAVPVPEGLGKLDVHQDTGVVTIGHNTSCSRKIVSSYADIALLPAAGAEPWLKALRYELRIDDDEPWVFYDSLPGMGMYFWNSSLGPGKDRLVVGCEAHPLNVAWLSAYRMMPVLVPGEHRVRMVGLLPDGTELSSEEVVLDMQCPPGTSGPVFDAGVAADAGSIFASNDKFQEVSPVPEAPSCAAYAPRMSRGWVRSLLLIAACIGWLQWRQRTVSRCGSTARLRPVGVAKR